MANGIEHPHKNFVQRYAETVIAVFCTLGSIVYISQLQANFAQKAEVTALKTEVTQSNAKTAAVVSQVKKDSSQAAGSAVAAQVAAQQAQTAADVVAAHRLFMSKQTEVQINDLDVRVRSLQRMSKTHDDQIRTNTDSIKALQQKR